MSHIILVQKFTTSVHQKVQTQTLKKLSNTYACAAMHEYCNTTENDDLTFSLLLYWVINRIAWFVTYVLNICNVAHYNHIKSASL